MWLPLTLKNWFLKWFIPVMVIVPVYLFATGAFFAGIAGFRFFQKHEIVTLHKDGIFFHEIVETTYFDCGTHYHMFHMRRGISNIPLRYITDWKHEKNKCKKCIDLLELYQATELR